MTIFIFFIFGRSDLNQFVPKNCEKIITIHWFYKIKSQPIWKYISEMNFNSLNEKQNKSTLVDIFIQKGLDIEILNNGTANEIYIFLFLGKLS